MEPDVRDLLIQSDDAEHAEYPPGFDWFALRGRLVALQPELERITGRVFVLDDGAQDASFFGDLAITRPGPRPNCIETIFAARFSNFGGLFTTWSYCQAEEFPAAVAAEVVAAVQRAGFRFIPPAALGEPYTGRHDGFRHASWWLRFFDYL